MKIPSYYSRVNPCGAAKNERDAEDLWKDNPSVTSTFSDFLVFKNKEYGVLAVKTGNIILNNFTVVDNKKVGIEF